MCSPFFRAYAPFSQPAVAIVSVNGAFRFSLTFFLGKGKLNPYLIIEELRFVPARPLIDLTKWPYLRPAQESDLPAMLEIYRPYVEQTAVSFE